MKLPPLFPICFLLASCNSAFVVKSSKGTELGYTGSFASKSSLEHTEIHLANGATISKHIENNDEVESIKTLGRLVLGKAGISAATSATKEVTNTISN